jgi:hypothetical protein
MTGPHRQLLRVATRIHQWIVTGRTELPAVALSGLPWQQLQTLARQVSEARRRGFSRAAHRLLGDISASAERLHLQLLGVDWRRCYERPTPASAAELFRDLLALQDEFEGVRWNLDERSLSVVTSRIVLEEVDLGPFEVCIEWKVCKSEPAYRVVALDPNPCGVDESVTHPHVSNESLCEGEGRAAIQAALEMGRLYDFFLLVSRVLNNYSRGNAYAELDEWDGVRCTDCGSVVSSTGACACYKCDATLCSDCCTSCIQCDDGLCSSCIASCAHCQQACCPGCLTPCAGCGRQICGDCRDDDLCVACHKLKECDDETDDSIEQASQPGSPPAGFAV